MSARGAVTVAIASLLTSQVSFGADEPPKEVSIVTPGRLAWAGGTAALIAGVGLGVEAQSQSSQAKSLTDARASSHALRASYADAAAANVLYALAGAAAVYGLMLEFLPQRWLDKATLTFHF